MEIILLRHGQPALPSLQSLSAHNFKSWVNAYNRAGLRTDSSPPEQCLRMASKSGLIICSQLKRSIESAHKLRQDHPIISETLLNEAGLPDCHWHSPRLSPRFWAIFFRILWLSGYSRNSESYRDARIRAEQAAVLLEQLAKQHRSILLVGHGVFNQMLANQLRKRGWKGPRKARSGHWSYSIYRYPETGCT